MTLWLSLRSVLALHTAQISEHGGLDGLRDAGLLESALTRPQNKQTYLVGDEADIPLLAAAYAYGLATNHCFIDGNKRIALMTSFVFLERNGWRMTASEQEAYQTFVRLASGDLSEDELVDWFCAHAVDESLAQ